MIDPAEQFMASRGRPAASNVVKLFSLSDEQIVAEVKTMKNSEIAFINREIQRHQNVIAILQNKLKTLRGEDDGKTV